jgi:hypothetical protein
MGSKLLLGGGVILLLVGALAGYLYGIGSTPARTQTSTQTLTQTLAMTSQTSSEPANSSCYYVLPEAVPCVMGQNFTLSVNYTGQWGLTYQGYNCSGAGCGIATTIGSYNGTGFLSATVTVEGTANGWTLCAQAQKLDPSNQTLELKVGSVENSTGVSHGSTSGCTQLVFA